VTDKLLSLSQLSSGYHSLQVLWDVDLQIHQGEWVALLGPNGAGKSTLLKTIAGLLKPFSGKIFFNDDEISKTPVYERVTMGIAMVPEGRRLFTGMTVKENLAMGAFTCNDEAKSAKRLALVFDLFPALKERQGQIVGTLSGGERQMCAIGRALMSQPRLLLVDEMSLGLAPVVVDDLLEAMATIKQEGMTLLVVEQDVHVGLVYADRGYVLRQGRIVKSGMAEKLLKDPDIQKDYLGLDQ